MAALSCFTKEGHDHFLPPSSLHCPHAMHLSAFQLAAEAIGVARLATFNLLPCFFHIPENYAIAN